MQEIKFLIDDGGEVDIINENGKLLNALDESAIYIKEYLICEEIREELLKEDWIRNNPEVRNSIKTIVKNYYLERILMHHSLHNQILRLAIGASRDELEDNEDEYQ